MSSNQSISALALSLHRERHVEVPLSFGLEGPESQDFAKLGDSRIEPACVAQCLSQTEMRFHKIWLDFERAPVCGDGGLKGVLLGDGFQPCVEGRSCCA